MTTLNLGTRTPKGAIYFVKGGPGYFSGRCGEHMNFVPYPARCLAPRFTLRQAEDLAKRCKVAGYDVDVSIV